MNLRAAVTGTHNAVADATRWIEAVTCVAALAVGSAASWFILAWLSRPVEHKGKLRDSPLSYPAGLDHPPHPD